MAGLLILLAPAGAFVLSWRTTGGTEYVRARWPFLVGYYVLVGLAIVGAACGGAFSALFRAVPCVLLVTSPFMVMFLLVWDEWRRPESRGFDVLPRHEDGAGAASRDQPDPSAEREEPPGSV